MCIAGSTALIITLGTGFLIGWFIAIETQSKNEYMQNGEEIPDWMRDIDPAITEKLVNRISAQSIESFLRLVSFFLNDGECVKCLHESGVF